MERLSEILAGRAAQHGAVATERPSARVVGEPGEGGQIELAVPWLDDIAASWPHGMEEPSIPPHVTVGGHARITFEQAVRLRNELTRAIRHLAERQRP